MQASNNVNSSPILTWDDIEQYAQKGLFLLPSGQTQNISFLNYWLRKFFSWMPGVWNVFQESIAKSISGIEESKNKQLYKLIKQIHVNKLDPGGELYFLAERINKCKTQFFNVSNQSSTKQGSQVAKKNKPSLNCSPSQTNTNKRASVDKEKQTSNSKTISDGISKANSPQEQNKSSTQDSAKQTNVSPGSNTTKSNQQIVVRTRADSISKAKEKMIEDYYIRFWSIIFQKDEDSNVMDKLIQLDQLHISCTEKQEKESQAGLIILLGRIKPFYDIKSSLDETKPIENLKQLDEKVKKEINRLVQKEFSRIVDYSIPENKNLPKKKKALASKYEDLKGLLHDCKAIREKLMQSNVEKMNVDLPKLMKKEKKLAEISNICRILLRVTNLFTVQLELEEQFRKIIFPTDKVSFEVQYRNVEELKERIKFEKEALDEIEPEKYKDAIICLDSMEHRLSDFESILKELKSLDKSTNQILDEKIEKLKEIEIQIKTANVNENNSLLEKLNRELKILQNKYCESKRTLDSFEKDKKIHFIKHEIKSEHTQQLSAFEAIKGEESLTAEEKTKELSQLLVVAQNMHVWCKRSVKKDGEKLFSELKQTIENSIRELGQVKNINQPTIAEAKKHKSILARLGFKTRAKTLRNGV